MKLTDLKNKLETKKGFHSYIADNLADDNVQGDPIEKRFFYINHLNADGTMGKTYVYYLLDTTTQDAWFYNLEAESIDTKEPDTNQKKVDALETYLSSNFNAYFINKIDYTKNWAEADTYKYNATTKLLDKKVVIVYKKGTDPITHIEVA